MSQSACNDIVSESMQSTWQQLEKLTASPIESSNSNNISGKCGSACPICSNQLSDFTLPVKRKGIESFLCDVFIASSSETIDGNSIVKKLQKFPNAGIVIYGRPKSPLSPDAKFLQIAVLQLIAAELIMLNASSENPKPTFSLGITGTAPSYMLDNKWENIPLIP